MHEQISDFPTFVKVIKSAARLINAIDDVVYIVSHIDADGITCAGIIAQLLYILDKPFILKFVNHINSDFLIRLNDEAEPREIMFCDLGSGSLDLITQHLTKASRVYILDHHIPSDNLRDFYDKAPFKLIHINPRLFGYDGSSEISSSGISYLLAHVFLSTFHDIIDLSKYAIIGALGDNQDIGEKRSLVGLNSLIVKEAKENGIIEEKIDLLILGRRSKPLYQALAETFSPILPGITGSLEGALKFITNIGIGVGRLDVENITLDDLDEKQKSLLLEKLIERVSISFSEKISVEEIKDMLIGYVYLLSNEEKPMLIDAREFSTLLNACGKLRNPQLGISLLIGKKDDFYDRAVSLYKRYKYSISEGIKKARSSINDYNGIKVIDGDPWLDEDITSTIASIMARNIVDGDVLIVFSKKVNNYVKVSVRKLLKSKIQNIRELLMQVVNEIGIGEAGGHESAAGAYIPSEKKEDLIRLIRDKMRMVS